MILIDTNIFVDHLRNFGPAVKFFESLAGRDDVIFSAITEAELIAGKSNKNKEKKEKLLYFINRWNKISVTNPVALQAGDISREYELEIPDAIIAATALQNNAEVVTKNIKDFQKVEGLKIKVPY